MLDRYEPDKWLLDQARRWASNASSRLDDCKRHTVKRGVTVACGCHVIGFQAHETAKQAQLNYLLETATTTTKTI